MMKIYTRQGDSGQTALFDGRRVAKNDLRIETYGTIDELNSHLGLALVDCRHEDLRATLVRLQNLLFDLGADLATPADSPNAGKIRRIDAEHISQIESAIDAAAARLPALRFFVLPGGSITAARLHVARTVCRRAERLLVTLMGHEALAPEPLIFVNRLGDLLFMLARLANQADGEADVPWQPVK